jgi:parallel beta-helix repeat protein
MEKGEMSHYKLLTLVCFTITVLVLVGTASAKTWYVDDDDGPEIDFTKIQLAVDAASDGDIIEVRSGTYDENVDLNKQLILMGVDTGEGKPVVDAERDGSPIAVMVDGCTVDGFNAIGSDDEDDGAGIRLESSNNMIANNLINSNHGRGIFLLGPSNNNTISTNDINHNDGVGICLLDDCVDNRLIDNNVCFNGDHGIELEGDCTNSTLLNNNASFNGEIGIYIIECDNATLTNNTVSNNEGGIFLNDGRNYILRNNTINNNTCNFDVEYGDVQDIDTSNTIGGKPIYYLVNQANVVIDSSWNAGYVGVVDSNNITVKDLTLTNNGQGVLFDDVQNSRIENMIVENNTWGIYLMDSSGITLRNNNANSNEKYGIYIDDEYDNSIDTSNTVNGKPVYYFYDIHDQTINNLNTAHLTIAESSNIIIKDNNISGGDGIVLSDVDDSNIINNLVSGNFYGIHVDKSNNNIFTSNYANLNKNVGIDIDGDSTNNIIANNHANENGLHGIKIDGDSNNNTITNNYANANYGKCGIRISADNNTVSNNHAAFNTLSGIHVANSKYNRIANNNASFNGHGICVWYSSTNNIIINNTLSNNEWGGSSLHKSDSNEFIGNTIFNNSGGGLGGGGSYNSFINNDIHGGYGSCISLSGRFWSSYRCLWYPCVRE